MDINRYIENIELINTLIDETTTDDVRKIFKKTSEKVDDLTKRLSKYKSKVKNPYNEITIDFKSEVKISVRSANKKTEIILSGREDFDVVGFTDNFFILNDSKWGDTIGLKLTYNKLNTRITQKGDVNLFYNRDSDLTTGKSTRSSSKEEILYQIIKLK
jgi:hypothetical protein